MEGKILSIIVPLYNGEKYLSRLLESILGQEWEGLEILLVNDGSQDGTERVCLEWKEKYPQIINYIKKRNGGVCETRNVGIDNAKGKYFGFADQDDFFEPEAVGKLLEKAKSMQADMLIFEPQVTYSNGKKQVLAMPVGNGEWEGKELFNKIVLPMVFGIKNEYGQGFNFGLWNCLFNKEVFSKYDLHLDTYLRMGEDITFITQALCYAEKVETFKEPLYNWFVNLDSVSHTYVKASELSITKTKYIIHKKEEAMSKFPKEEWEQYIHPSYAHIIASFARNWTHPLSGEKMFDVIKRVKSIYKDAEIMEHVKKTKITYSQGKEKIENWLVKHKLVLCLIIYFYALHFYVGIRNSK